MTSVSRLDQAVLLLRDRLERLARRDGPVTAGVTQTGRTAEAPDEPLRRLARDGRLSRAALKKALVRGLLTEAFGAELASTLAFQSIADEVSAILERDPETSALVERALSEIGI